MNIKRLLELSGVSTDKKEKTNLNEHIIGGMMDVPDMTSRISESGWNGDFDLSEDYHADNELRWSDYFDNDREAGNEDEETIRIDDITVRKDGSITFNLYGEMFTIIPDFVEELASDGPYLVSVYSAETSSIDIHDLLDYPEIEEIKRIAREHLSDRLNEDAYDVQITDEDEYDLDDELELEDFEQLNYDPYADEEYVNGPESHETIETDDAYELAKELISMGLDEDSVMMAVGQQYGLSDEELSELKDRVLGQGDVIAEDENTDALVHAHDIFENKELGSLKSFTIAARKIRSMVKQGNDIDESIDQVCSKIGCEASRDLLKDYVLATLKENNLMENPLAGIAVRAAAGAAGTKFADRAADKIFGSSEEDLEENTVNLNNDRKILEKYFDVSKSLRKHKLNGDEDVLKMYLIDCGIDIDFANKLSRMIIVGELDKWLNRAAMNIAYNYVDGNSSPITDFHGLLSDSDEITRLEGKLKSGNVNEGYIDHDECEYTNMLDDEHYVDGEEYFPDGAHHAVTDEVGPSSAKHGDNSMQKRMAVSEAKDIKRDLVYKYRKFLKENK